MYSSIWTHGIYKLKNTARVGVDLTNVKPIPVAVVVWSRSTYILVHRYTRDE